MVSTKTATANNTSIMQTKITVADWFIFNTWSLPTILPCAKQKQYNSNEDTTEEKEMSELRRLQHFRG